MVSFRCKTLQRLRIWFEKRVSDRQDGRAGRTVTGVTDRHSVRGEKGSFVPYDDLCDGPSQV